VVNKTATSATQFTKYILLHAYSRTTAANLRASSLNSE